MITSPSMLQFLLFGTGFMFMLPARFYLAALMRDTRPESLFIVTQRKRFLHLALGQITAPICLAIALIGYGTDATWSCLREWLSYGGLIGWAVIITNAFAAVSPILSMLTALMILMFPAKLAKRIGENVYVPTEFTYEGRGASQVFPHVNFDTSGKLRRNYYPND